MNRTTHPKLFLMMVLEFFIWGAWLPLIFGYLPSLGFAAWPFTFILVDWDKVHAANPSGFVSWLGTVLSNGLTGPALQNATRYTYIVAGIGSLLLAGLSLILPHTPPKKAVSSQDKLAWV